MIRFFIDYSLCSLDSVELAVVEDELSVEEPSVDEAVVELLVVEDLVSSVSASRSLERASQYFLYSPSNSEFLLALFTRVFAITCCLDFFTKGIDDQV